MSSKPGPKNRPDTFNFQKNLSLSPSRCYIAPKPRFMLATHRTRTKSLTRGGGSPKSACCRAASRQPAATHTHTHTHLHTEKREKSRTRLPRARRRGTRALALARHALLSQRCHMSRRAMDADATPPPPLPSRSRRQAAVPRVCVRVCVRATHATPLRNFGRARARG